MPQLTRSKERTRSRVQDKQSIAAGGKVSKKGKQIPSIELPLSFSPSISRIVGLAAAVIAAALALYFVFIAKSVNSTFGFPLDDAWIHLSFARTIAETGRFAYYAGGQLTSGSTSPLFTLLEAVLWLFTHHEYLIAYTLGIAGFACSVALLFEILKREYSKEVWVAVIGALTLAIQPKILGIAVSGMETTWAMAIMLACSLMVAKRRWLWAGVLAGLAIWTRPDTLLFVSAIAAQVFYDRWIRKDIGDSSDLKKGAIAFVLLALAYLAFNFVLSGNPFPNTMSAKLEYYKSGGDHFGRDLWEFANQDGMIVALMFFSVSLVGSIKNVLKKLPADKLFAHVFVIALIAAYWWKLPYLYQGGRYILPAVPFFLIVAMDGLQRLRDGIVCNLKSAKLANLIPLVLVFLMLRGEVSGIGMAKTDFIERSAYIGDLQVRTALWSKENLPKNAVIATHDIGALGFYSGRPVVDVVGLIDKDIHGHIGDPKATVAFMHKRGVTHMAFLTNWMEVPNEKPLMQTDPRAGEVMQILPFSDHTEITTPVVLSIHKYAEQNIGAGNTENALEALREGIQLEPANARTHYLAAIALSASKQMEGAEAEFRLSLSAFPNNPAALAGFGRVFAAEGKNDSAVTYLKQAVAQDSLNIEALTTLSTLTSQGVNTGLDRTAIDAQLSRAKAVVEANTPRVVRRQNGI